MIEAAKARYCKHSQTIKNFNHKRDQSQILVLAFWFLIIYRECTLLPALAESCSVADSKGLRILTTFFIMFLSLSVILFFSVCDVWRRIKETRTSRRDSLITWGGGQTVWRTWKTTLLQPSSTTDPKATSFKSKRKEAVFICWQHCSQLLHVTGKLFVLSYFDSPRAKAATQKSGDREAWRIF